MIKLKWQFPAYQEMQNHDKFNYDFQHTTNQCFGDSLTSQIMASECQTRLCGDFPVTQRDLTRKVHNRGA